MDKQLQDKFHRLVFEDLLSKIDHQKLAETLRTLQQVECAPTERTLDEVYGMCISGDSMGVRNCNSNQCHAALGQRRCCEHRS